MHRLAGMALFGTALSAWPLQASAAVNWDVATGFDYSTGKYGAPTDTSVLSIPLGLRAQLDKFRLELTVPYLQVHGPGTSASGVVVDGSNLVTTRSGLGDISMGAAWLLHQDTQSFPGIELAGAVKLPTASLELGTGKFDYSIQANLAHWISPSVLLFGALGYQWLGDFRGFILKDGVTAQGGVNVRTGEALNIGLSAYYRQPYYQTLSDQFSVSPYALWSFASHWRVSGYGLVGFTNASPRIGGGVRLIYFQ
jgi:outer membrane putative beta-barrel porin/alpha-amylase